MENGLRGNLHAIEYLLGQLFVIAIERVEDPQGWLNHNTVEAAAKVRRPGTLTPYEAECAYGTVRRVMQTASFHFAASGRGPALPLTRPSRPDEE